MTQARAAPRVPFCLALALAVGLVLTAGCDTLSWTDGGQRGDPLPFEITSVQEFPDSLHPRVADSLVYPVIETGSTAVRIQRALIAYARPLKEIKGSARLIDDTIRVTIRPQRPKNPGAVATGVVGLMYEARIPSLQAGRYTVELRHIDGSFWSSWLDVSGDEVVVTTETVTVGR